LADPQYKQPEEQRLGGWRTMLGVPLLREGVAFGALTLTRSTVRPFTDKQIELLETFADQAVIAIENVRLFDEVQSRTRALSRSIEELRALGAVSQAVNSNPNLQTVLDHIVVHCDAVSRQAAARPHQRRGRRLRQLGVVLLKNPSNQSGRRRGRVNLPAKDHLRSHTVWGAVLAPTPVAR
jgi:hypothetical protein